LPETYYYHGLLAISVGPWASAQTAPQPGTSQPYFNPAPPPGFDPVSASDADLRTYGFPPRPPLTSAAYPSWIWIVSSAKTRVPNPAMWRTGVNHHPPLQPSATPGILGTNYNSPNWSGLGVTGSSSNYFMNNDSTVTGTWSVPAIVSSLENCSYTPYIASIWVGFDGYVSPGNNDVLQAGINAVACQSYPNPSYYAWYEWYTEGCYNGACYETEVNLPINQGDIIIITVTYYTSSPNGNAFIDDFTTGQYVSVSYNQPSGSSGSAYAVTSAEWIVERPETGGTLDNLTDYGTSFYMEGTYNGYLPGSGPANSPDYFTMQCNSYYPWNPSSACTSTTNLSYVSAYNSSSGQISFTPTGPTITYY